MEVAEKNLRKGKIGQQVKRETLQKSIREDEIGIGDIDKALARLRKSLAAKTDAQFNGITYTLAQQTELARKLLERRKNSTKVIAGKAKALELVKRSVVTLEEQHEKCLATIARCKELLEEAKVKREALATLEEGSRLIGEVDHSFSENLKIFEEEIRKFSEEVEIGLRFEEGNLQNSVNTDDPMDEIGNIIDSTPSSTDVLSDINSVLGFEPGI